MHQFHKMSHLLNLHKSCPQLYHHHESLFYVPSKYITNKFDEYISNNKDPKDAVPILIERCLSHNNDIIYSGLESLLEISDNKDEDISDVLQANSAKLLNCIISGMSVDQDEDFMETQTLSMELLCKLCPYFKEMMETVNERNVIVLMVCCASTNSENEDLQLQSFKTMKELISSYTREAGVRNLEREIANVLRKAAREVVEDDTKKIRINKSSGKEI